MCEEVKYNVRPLQNPENAVILAKAGIQNVLSLIYVAYVSEDTHLCENGKKQ